MLQNASVDMENMLDILNVEEQVKDDEDATEIEVKGGKIEFENVSFGYCPE